MTDDLLAYGAVKARQRALTASPEWDFIVATVSSCLNERPTEPIWKWADHHVYLDDKMSAEPGPYDSAKTPWTRELQELPLRPDVREAVVKKSSRTGVSEAALNIARWMPGHWPGNVGIIFPEDKQARDVASRRILASVERSAGAQLTEDANDRTLSKIALRNMNIMVGPSGSPRMFTEIWFRFIVLDEYEEHSTVDTTTTYDRALSRQTDVADGLLIAISKPKRAGGPIDLAYIRGTQKKYLVPCPRCERLIEFQRSHFVYDHCRQSDGSWDLDAVKASTFYRCQLCQGEIQEAEKFAMTNSDLARWTPALPAQRKRPPDGKYVPPQPGVESYQISDYYANHARVGWGNLMALYLEAFEIAPTPLKQTHFINNHEGEADEPKLIAVDPLSIRSLIAGRVESREITAADGSKQTVQETIGIPGGYRLAYLNVAPQARLPFKPALVLIFIDKQKSCLKYLVYAIVPNGDAYLIDLGKVDDEDHLYSTVLPRRYYTEGDDTPAMISAGLFDSRYRGQEVFRFCLRAHHERRLNIWPVRGEGEREREGKTAVGTDYKGKVLRFVEDRCDLGALKVRWFKDAAVKAEFYGNKIQKRVGKRMWLPVDYPDVLAAEWTAERWNEEMQEWEHDERKHGPNDYGDCGKYLCLWELENLEAFLAIHAPPPPSPPLSAKPARDYELKPRGIDNPFS